MPHKQTEEEAHRAFSHGSSGATADMAVEATPKPEDRHIDVPHTRAADPADHEGKHDHMAEKEAKSEDRQEALIDEAVEETFPASDPISPKHIT